MASYSRSNVNDLAFSKSAVDMSSFNLNRHISITPKLGLLHPVRATRLMPNSTVSGSVSPELQLEKVISPQIGRTRLDTHTFAVPFRRLCNDFKQKMEGYQFSSADPNFNFGAFVPEDLWGSFFDSLFFYSKTRNPYLSLTIPFEVWSTVETHLSDGVYDILKESVSVDENFAYTDYYNLFHTTGIWVSFENVVRSALLHIAAIYACYAYDDDESSLYNYPKDFYAQEVLRLIDLYNLGQFNPLLIVRNILEPYFGINSNMDYLGYPILRMYDCYEVYESLDGGVSVSSLTPVPTIDFNYDSSHYSQNSVLFFFRLFVGRWSNGIYSLNNEEVADFIGLKPFRLLPTLQIVDLYSVAEFLNDCPFRKFSDFALRAAYCCWFDRFRDWHIEKRDMCLDPDSIRFSSASLFSRFTGPIASEYQYLYTVSLERCVVYALCVPRNRFYSDDALTTIQTDDKFRHVYSPILGLDTISGAVDTQHDDVLNRIESIYLDSLAVAFPSGSLFSNVTSKDNISALRNDLCLAKRAGMLERWLARNYFTPDNYNGFISTHYDTDVSDLDMIISKYLGGSEQLVSGEQQVADISTSETVRGTRTFSGGVSTDSSFSLHTTDYTYLVSFVSLVPLVEYDSLEPSNLEIFPTDIPFPEYANDTRIEIRLQDILRGFPLNDEVIGYVPRYYFYRTTLDQVHGRFLTDYRNYSWFRDWHNMTFTAGDKYGSHGFDLSPYSLRVHLPLDSFLGLAPWDSIAFGSVSLPLSTNIPLPAAIEII